MDKKAFETEFKEAVRNGSDETGHYICILGDGMCFYADRYEYLTDDKTTLVLYANDKLIGRINLGLIERVLG